LADPGTVLLFHPSQTHRITHPVEGGDECTSLHLSPEQFQDAFGDAPSAARSWLLDRPAQRRVHLAVNTLRMHPDELACDEAAMEILQTLAQAPQFANHQQTEAIRVIRERLAADPSERATLQELASGVGLSAYELARRFRLQTGTSIHQYRLRLRLSVALSQLRDGVCDITALALDLGFANHAHFSTAFRAAFGTTPKAVRNMRAREARSGIATPRRFVS
jgi:AraC-like DNA-binding protein